MRALLLWLLTTCAVSSAWAAPIDEVLQRSQQRRLLELPAARADEPRVAIVRASFERLRATMQIRTPVELHVVSGPVVAETLLGHIIVANQALGDLPEGERLFVLAHELSHVALGHWATVGALYRTHVPGAVVREHTDRVAAVLGREASALMHKHELEADAFALQVLAPLGYGSDVAMAVFLRAGVQHDTATHPGTRKRVAHLRTLL